MNKEHLKAVAMIVAVVAGITYIQRNVYAIPLIGGYLPK